MAGHGKLSIATMLVAFSVSPFSLAAQTAPAQKPKQPSSKQNAAPKPPTPDEELQKALESAGNDRAALVRNLEAFLKKYPESPQRPQIYRALVEASIQLRDTPRAADYAERIVALNPEDVSITLLAIQLLERNGDESGLHRAVNYSSRVLNYIENSSIDEKSPKVSREEWETDKKRDQMSVLSLRGRLNWKLHDAAAAQKDFEASYAILPSAASAEMLGEIAESKKDWPSAIAQYGRAFALSDTATGSASRRELRQKIGNVWRLAHGSEDGLGDFLLRTFDDVAKANASVKQVRNSGLRDPYEFNLRNAPDGMLFPLSSSKGKILVVSFWATWCGPCRAQEPVFERVAAQFQSEHDVTFLEANCDEDESLVAPYLEEVKPKTIVVFADGLDNLFSINSFPTVLVIDRAGKIAFRSDGFDESSFEHDLSAAVRRTLSPAPSDPIPSPNR